MKSTRNDRFNESMHSLDVYLADTDPAKNPILSDRGKGVARMEEAIDGEDPLIEQEDITRQYRYHNALKLLSRKGLAFTIPTFKLIVKYRSDRKHSIEAIMRSRKVVSEVARHTYLRHFEKIAKCFKVPVNIG